MTDSTIFPTLLNDTLLRAARREPTSHVPVWMMRQAGRYLPEYRALREGTTFFETCRNAEMVVEITIQPVERFPIDAAIIFSDILVVPQAMGMEVKMIKGRGPVLPQPITDLRAVSRLSNPDVEEELGYVFEAIRQTRVALNGRVPLIGFSGAPWTLLAYMVEGGGSKTFEKARAMLYRDPNTAHQLLDRLTDVISTYMIGQVDAGAQYLQLFDSWAGLLGPEAFGTFSLPYMQRIARNVKEAHPDVPFAVFARGANHALTALSEGPFDVVSLDWMVDPSWAREQTGGRVALQGNLDPAVLYASPEEIRATTERMIDRFGTTGYIANLGHGMHPDHDPAHAGVFVDAVHSASSVSIL